MTKPLASNLKAVLCGSIVLPDQRLDPVRIRPADLHARVIPHGCHKSALTVACQMLHSIMGDNERPVDTDKTSRIHPAFELREAEIGKIGTPGSVQT